MVKIGPAFGDYIKFEKGQRHPSYSKNYSIRSYLLPLIIVISCVLILGRLFFLQVVKGSSYRSLSDANRTKTITIHAPRGIIFDRDGVPLVFNVPGFREKSGDKVKLIGKDEALKLISEGKNNLEIDSLRSYPYKDDFAHVLGYIGQISKEELARLPSPDSEATGGQEQEKFADYKGGDLIGKIGIEREYESLLRGKDGKELVEVDSMGRSVRKLGQSDPVPGQNITLTLDVALQKASFDATKDIKKGAVIVSTPQGEILSLISKPSFDSNLFTMGEGYSVEDSSSYKSISQILLDQESQPLLNRTIAGTYPPGSTFKLITAAAGLEDKVIDRSFSVEDTGVLRLGDFSFGNWYYIQHGKTDGVVDVIKGIARSNDIFFYKLAEKVGVNKLSQFAEKFGLGKKLGIDLEGEQEGTVPTPNWKKQVIGDSWYLGDTYHYGIGQGFLLTTPLHVNAWTQAIANGGTIYKPHLLLNTKYSILNTKFLSKETVSLIKEGMIESCSTGGVAWPFFDFKAKGKEIKIACKTGTAQHGGEETLPHAWITLFAPAENPEIIVTVLAESSGEGSSIAGPIAKKILEEWFGR
ncbi:MAG: penicillin-binding transpeptidase domain-containing protein [Candidatus Levybacteria bacterium]|nr:penicillin-binding transpeptidase domain-containing protein [Candidatus Levybacteria bacterium]MDZ4228458.1 penicillin-binding transpeptidase domain-containing protein [Candidatus Levybacteria bacterium]